ncbi:MAG: T9SS type A sorting domain-containing protein [Crocinitomicaceae bacterium]|nr:T9SS type A sorting domain-containing protein [Crocinitomicaceae bacterium]
MLKSIWFLFLFFCSFAFSQQWTITEVGQLPEPITNNPVCEGWQGDTLYIYTFGGLDATLTSTGIHRRAYRYNTISEVVESIPDLPDTLGKLGVAAHRIGDIIYVTGGYHVLSGGSEITSDKVHRFNTQTNSWLTDAPNIPVATDDHVQSVWRDSLLFLVTGWKNTTNIQHCQIFDPANNQWLSATSVPNSHDYKSFGASGVIIGDEFYYFGGTSAWTFGPQNKLRIGTIDPNDPTNVTWTIQTPDVNVFGYRMAAAKVNNEAHWIGGASLSYNFDGIDYNGSGVVAPANRDAFIQAGTPWLYTQTYDTIPMDLRGIGNASDSIKYIMGGMFDGQNVSNKIYKLEYTGNAVASLTDNLFDKLKIYPNPTTDLLLIDGIEEFELKLTDTKGNLLLKALNSTKIHLNHLAAGIYLVHLKTKHQTQIIKIIKE